MGIPYSKQINLAFDQVTPLVGAGFEVLQTTRNITYLLAAIQVLTAVFLGLILATLLALIITVNPDLETERKSIVTPVIKWLAGSVGWLKVGAWIIILGAGLGAIGGWWITREDVVVEVKGPEEEDRTGDSGADGDSP